MMRKKRTAVAAPSPNTILIRGQEVPVVSQRLEQNKLRFYSENPRVYSVVRGNGKIPTQEEMQKRLLEMDHVRELIHDIRLNKGLIEPLIVRDKTYEVVEGNSRLAAYRFLAKSDPVKWGYVKCTLLPHDIDESLVFALLGQFHIKGKKDWAPYEQAGFVYRRFKNHHANMRDLAVEIGISSKKLRHLVETYDFMVKNNEDDVSRWSYYDEYLKSKKISRAREKHPALDSVVIKKIRTKEIERAMDLRDRLPVICSSPNALTKFMDGNLAFSEAHETAVEHGGSSIHLNNVKKFREWVTCPQIELHLLDYDSKVRRRVIFELGKIQSRIRHLLKKLR